MKNAKGKEMESERAWIDNSAPAKRVSAYVILRGGEVAGKLLVLHPLDHYAGHLRVNLYDWTSKTVAPEVYYGDSHVSGIDEITAALAGCLFGDHQFVYPGEVPDRRRGTWDLQLTDWGYKVQKVI